MLSMGGLGIIGHQVVCCIALILLLSCVQFSESDHLPIMLTTNFPFSTYLSTFTSHAHTHISVTPHMTSRSLLTASIYRPLPPCTTAGPLVVSSIQRGSDALDMLPPGVLASAQQCPSLQVGGVGLRDTGDGETSV